MQVQRIVCDFCHGTVPEAAPYIGELGCTFVQPSNPPAPFAGLDFCSTACLVSYANANLEIATPNAPYPEQPA